MGQAPPDGFSINVDGAGSIVASLRSVASGLSASYAYFGANTTIAVSPGAPPENVLGTMDSSGVDVGPPDVADGWLSFTEAWGQLMDEVVGGVTKLAAAKYLGDNPSLNESIRQVALDEAQTHFTDMFGPDGHLSDDLNGQSH